MKKTEWMARRATENITARISLLGRLVSEPVYFDALKDHLTSRLPNWNVTMCEREPVEGAVGMARRST